MSDLEHSCEDGWVARAEQQVGHPEKRWQYWWETCEICNAGGRNHPVPPDREPFLTVEECTDE